MFTDHILLNGSQAAGTLSWTATFHNSFTAGVNDTEDDGNLDSSDYFIVPGFVFSGYYFVAPNAMSYAIFQNGSTGDYYIPFNAADYPLQDNIPASGSTSNYRAENFEPSGNPVCFLAGSLIATPTGEVEVEALKPGDRISTADGREVAVKWLGIQSFSSRFRPAERAMPVRIGAHALGENAPHSDLTVTADHGMLVDGIICHAGALVNGGTITRVPLTGMGGTYRVYHVETEEHEVILANGAPAETFIDNARRQAFDNFAEFEALHGDVPEMVELPYPRAMSARQVPQAIRLRLAARTCPSLETA